MSNAWPINRSRRSTIAAQFGADRADLLEWALTTGDPLADSVIGRMADGDEQIRDDLHAGLRHGLSSLKDPDPAVAALLADTERMAPYLDDELLENGSRPFHSMPPAVHIVSLSMGALIRVYQSPSIAAVLAGTGRLITGAENRIRETGKWLGTAMLPGALRVGAPGYVATLGVRLLHAKVRRRALEGGFADREFGVPINQVDLGRTWMDFTLTAWGAEGVLGYRLNSQETAQLFRLWWHVGHLLGVDARLIEGIGDQQQAARVDELFQSVTGPPIPESEALAAATIDSIKQELQTALNLPKPIGQRALWSLVRRFHGNATADELKIPRVALADPLISGAIELIERSRAKARTDSVDWESMIDRNIAGLRQQLQDVSSRAQYEE